MSTETEVRALAAVTRDGTIVRGKIPVSVVRALKAQAGDVLAFERRADGAVVVRKASAAERKAAKR